MGTSEEFDEPTGNRLTDTGVLEEDCEANEMADEKREPILRSSSGLKVHSSLACWTASMKGAEMSFADVKVMQEV